jgi:uncharacterized protein YggU (UPF0235/DUF167 family)
MHIKVKVKPNGKENSVKKVEDTYVVSVTVPPVDGKANEKTIELLADFFKLPKTKFKVLRGLSSRNKIIEIMES